jgi:hypothetical protein
MRGRTRIANRIGVLRQTVDLRFLESIKVRALIDRPVRLLTSRMVGTGAGAVRVAVVLTGSDETYSLR